MHLIDWCARATALRTQLTATERPTHRHVTSTSTTISPPILASDAWSIEFQRRSSKTSRTPPTYSISLVAQTSHLKWHVRVTFCGELQTGQQAPNWTKRWLDFRHLCNCIDFGRLPLLDNTVTELLILPKADVQFLRLPLRMLPSNDSDYAAFQKADLRFRIREYARRIRYPLYAR